MALLTPPDPERVGPPQADRRWLAVPVLAVAGSQAPTSPPSIAPTLDSIVTGGTSAAADPVYTHQIETVPWANELVADAGGAWTWSDSGIVSRIGTDEIVTKTD